MVGAGPAGATAALTLLRERPSAQVLLLDRCAFPRDKVCGDGIAPHVFALLADLGVSPEQLHADHPAQPTLRLVTPAGAVAERRFAIPGRVVPRQVFDARLVAAAVAAGAQLRTHRVRAVAGRSDRVTVDGWAGRFVIGADGAESVVRRQLAGPATGPVAVAVRGYAAAAPAWTGQSIVMSGRGWPAYAWAFPIGNGLANVGYGEVVGERPPTRADLLARLHALLPELAGPVDRVRGHRLPLSSGRPRIADGRVLLAGDARALINPLTGEGIFYAVRSGMLAGRAVAAALADPRLDAGRKYRRSSRPAFERHFRHTTLLSSAVRARPLLEAGVRAARDDQGVFDDLVEIGLGTGPITPRLVTGLVRAGVRT